MTLPAAGFAKEAEVSRMLRADGNRVGRKRNAAADQ